MIPMMNPWLSFWSLGMEAARTSLRFGEMLVASRDVIDSRTRKIGDAARNPLKGDYKELGRMVPEKVDALARSGSSIFADFGAIQADLMANWGQMMMLALSGRPLNVADWTAMGARSTRIVDRANGASGRALAPIHRRATVNARRLRRQA